MDPQQALGLIKALFDLSPTVVLAFVVWILWRENKQERADHHSTLKGQIEAQAQMLQDYSDFTGAMRDLTNAVNNRGHTNGHR